MTMQEEIDRLADELLALRAQLDEQDEYERPRASYFSHLGSQFVGLPGLRGLWYPGVADQTGAVYDASGQGRTLTYNGNPVINLHNDLVPYLDLDGTGDYLSRADEAGLDILGTETYIATALRGLTVGGWFWVDTLGVLDGLITKYNTTGNQRSWNITVNSPGADAFDFIVSVDGTATHIASSGAGSVVTGQWYFVAGKWVPGVETSIFLNDHPKVSNVTTPPATIFNSTAALEIGRRSAAGTELDGRFPLGFLCAAALPDSLITYLFARTRGFFGV